MMMTFVVWRSASRQRLPLTANTTESPRASRSCFLCDCCGRQGFVHIPAEVRVAGGSLASGYFGYMAVGTWPCCVSSRLWLRFGPRDRTACRCARDRVPSSRGNFTTGLASQSGD
jgi:hypothetical protein